MGGVATCVAVRDKDHAIVVSEGKDNNEFIVMRHSQFLKPINIINVYGDVESRTPVDEIDRKWEEIMLEISKIEARNENIILVGDLNKHLSSDMNNQRKPSHGGKLVEELLNSGDFVLVNRTDKTIGGPENPNDESKKSELDLVIISKSLFDFVLKLEIDKDLNWTPCRSI